MNELKMKAKAGVTLVELLVVILIVTILSVSMLPLLQPFVVEAQYAAEAIPVIGNLRTKIGLYQYDKGSLPDAWKVQRQSEVLTWVRDTTDSEKFTPAYYSMVANGVYSSPTPIDLVTEADKAIEHIGMKLDVNYEDLKGKRTKPTDYQYYVFSPTNNPSYVIACFGSGENGLKAGTGYAVCELNFTGMQKKYIGTWKRYKPTGNSEAQLQFGSDAPQTKDVDYCYIPTADEFLNTWIGSTDPGEPALLNNMRAAGWEF